MKYRVVNATEIKKEKKTDIDAPINFEAVPEPLTLTKRQKKSNICEVKKDKKTKVQKSQRNHVLSG